MSSIPPLGVQPFFYRTMAQRVRSELPPPVGTAKDQTAAAHFAAQPLVDRASLTAAASASNRRLDILA